MILSNSPSGHLSRRTPRLLVLLTAAALPLLPLWATQAQDSPKEPSGTRVAGPSASEGAGRDASSKVAGAPESAHPVEREVSDYQVFQGATRAAQSVTLQPRVSGVVTRVLFPNGGMVKRGDLLFELDARAYQTELHKAQAELERAQARLKKTAALLSRQEGLLKRGRDYVSKEAVIQTQSEQEEAQADVDAAQAERELAQLHLDSTRVTAPIDGRVSGPELSEGNVAVADKTSLATISALDSIAVTGLIDERSALQIGRLLRAGKFPGAEGSELPVTMGLADETGFPHRGRVLSLFSQQNNVRQLRAVFPNPKHELVPGLTARVRITTSAPHKALLVPRRAIFHDGPRAYVSVQSPNQPGRVEPRFVILGPEHGEYVEVLGSELSPADALYIEPEKK